MIERLKTAGLWGAAIVLLIVSIPISVVSLVITSQLMFVFLGIALMVALVGYAILLPATVAAGLTGNEDNPKFVFGAAAVVAAVIVAGLIWFSLDQRAKSDAAQAQLIAEVRAGEAAASHPSTGAATRYATPSALRIAVIARSSFWLTPFFASATAFAAPMTSWR